VRHTATATRLWALDAPTFTVDSAQMIRGSTGQTEVPAPVYLVEHPKGLVVFDTSLTPLAYEDPYAAYGELATRLQMNTKPSQRPDRQLAELGYSVGDVSRVVISHLHFDHAGGVSLFPDAKVFVGSGEFELAYWPPLCKPGSTDARTWMRRGHMTSSTFPARTSMSSTTDP
jgi:N-acyl homoserine lactone hydrolase